MCIVQLDFGKRDSQRKRRKVSTTTFLLSTSQPKESFDLRFESSGETAILASLIVKGEFPFSAF